MISNTVKLYGPYFFTAPITLGVSNEDEYKNLIQRIADNIKNQRKKCGLTQAQMIDFGFDIKNYQKLEYGKHQFSLHTVFRLSRAFGCKIDDLINEPKRKKRS